MIINNALRSATFIALCCITTIGSAQQQDPCAFEQVNKSENVNSAERMIQQRLLNLRNTSSSERHSPDSIKVIPVVVHVIHDDGTENISDAQIESQIQILNEDFGKFEGSNGDGEGVDTKVRFCLARISPEGLCTNGIVRIKSSLTNHQTFERSMLKELSFWDNTRYLNIYVVKSINGGVLGYSSFPGGPADEDGSVVRHSVFGNIGTASSSLGRTASHELGHWFGLYHTFNNGCGVDICTDGDYVCDTPPQSSPSFNCTLLNSCSNDVPDVSDQRENYMNYTPDACKDMFTLGQKERMHAMLDTIRTYIWSEENLISTGCDSAYVEPGECPVVADFVTLTPEICFGNTVQFIDISLNDATSWQWSFPGGVPASSIEENPLVTYPDIGFYTVTLEAANDMSADILVIDQFIEVGSPGVGDALSYFEDLNSGVYPPVNTSIANPDGGITWELDSSAYTSPPYSIRINNLINTNYGSSDEIILPYFDFTSAPIDSTIRMRFNWAYAKSDPSFSDELIVLLSTDCGTTFDQVFYRTQSSLTSGPTQSTPFIPDSSQWNSADIDLDSYQNESYVQIKIVNVTDGGNNLYIDDINIDFVPFVTGLDNLEGFLTEFVIRPNPVIDLAILEYTVKESADVFLRVCNISGREVLAKKLNKAITGKNVFELETSDWGMGVYLVTIEMSGQSKTIKLLKN